MRWRLPFFSLLSLAGIAVGFGIPFGQANAAALVGIGLLLIGLAHLPTAFSLRLVLLAVVGAALIAIRATWVTLPLAPAVWPILGAMFMFRLPVYVYDLKTRSAPFSFWQATAYFFMLPNVCFPLYPIVDYKAFTKTYYNDDPIAIYQKGRRVDVSRRRASGALSVRLPEPADRSRRSDRRRRRLAVRFSQRFCCT